MGDAADVSEVPDASIFWDYVCRFMSGCVYITLRFESNEIIWIEGGGTVLQPSNRINIKDKENKN
jgi:hypothetical protein